LRKAISRAHWIIIIAEAGLNDDPLLTMSALGH